MKRQLVLEGRKEWAWFAGLDDCNGLGLALKGVRRNGAYELGLVAASFAWGFRTGGIRDDCALGLNVPRIWPAERQRVAPWPARMHFWQVCANLQFVKLQPDAEL